MALCKYFDKLLPLPVIGDSPHQPSNFKFPKREFGQSTIVKRSFQPQWFSRWTWLHYVEVNDLAYCYVCVKAYKENKLISTSNIESTYGYSNWKEAAVRFVGHEASTCHKDALLKVVTLSKEDVGESLCSAHAQEKKENQRCLLKILTYQEVSIVALYLVLLIYVTYHHNM
jgi:hypothetical protein